MEESPISVLESVRMDYSHGVPLYQDKPKYGLILKLILVLPVVLIAVGIYYWSTGEAAGGMAFLGVCPSNSFSQV